MVRKWKKCLDKKTCWAQLTYFVKAFDYLPDIL